MRDNLPDLLDAALGWEIHNFRERLSAWKNRLPRTDRWLEQVRWFPDDRLSEWHGRAIASFLMAESLWSPLDFPELMVLGEAALRKAKSSLDALAMVSVGETQLGGFLECYAASRASSEEKLALQNTLLKVERPANRAGRMVDAIIDAVVAALKARDCDVNVDTLRDAHRESMMRDLTDMTAPLCAGARDFIEDRLASELAEPSMNDDPDERVTPWLVQVQSVARDLRRFMEVDRAVHGQYYADRFNARNPS